jgi:MtN3 and saliva related transmembrane protein
MIQYFVGLIAGFGTTFSFLPQIYHLYTQKHNNIDSLSPYLLFIHFSGASAWIFYGCLQHDFIIITFNTLTVFFVVLIIIKFVHIKYYSQSAINNLN